MRNWLNDYLSKKIKRPVKNQNDWQSPHDWVFYPVKDENGDIIFRLGKAKHAAVQE